MINLSSFSKVIITSFISAYAFSVASAATTDSEGMPIVYLRGKSTGWNADEKYKFTRTGNNYSLTITQDNPVRGEFKLGDSEKWEVFDFGGEYGNTDIDSSVILSLKTSGPNLNTKELTDAVISFTYEKDSNPIYLNVSFKINGIEPVAQNPWSGTLPVMHINVYTDKNHTTLNDDINNYDLSHKDYFYAQYWIDVNDCEWMKAEGAKSVGSEDSPLDLQIKARGNWTRIGFSKKPFKIKLDKKQDLLGLTPDKSKHYALLAHADDNYGYLRNFTMFNLGKRIGLPWTPKQQPIELVINGNYRGLYFLTESIRVGDGRIDIEELGDNVSDSELISGGYVVELDNYPEDNQIVMEEKNCTPYWRLLDDLRITWDTPEVYSDNQIRFVTDQFTIMNNYIGANNDEIWKYMDLDDAVRYYLVMEIISHTEAYHGSTYLYRDRGEGQKWHFSPLWDAGNAFNGSTTNFFYSPSESLYGNTWIPSLRENSTFNDKVRKTWLWFMQNEYNGLEDDMATYAEHLKAAAKADKKRWGGERTPASGQPVADNTDMDSKLSNAKYKLTDKINWLRTQFGDYLASSKFEEPDRDNTEAAPLPEYATSRIPEFSTPEYDGEVEYYNLQGVRIMHPRAGEIYIVRKGNKSFKAIFR